MISDVPGLSDIFSHYNAVVSFKVGSKDSLKNSLNALLEDLSNDRIVVKDLKSDLENYSIQNFLKRYEEFYKKI